MEWKEIKGTKGYYLVSDTGKVFSTRSNRLLTIGHRGDYCYVEFNIDGKAEKHYLHRLVAEAFIPNPNGYEIINHKDENPANNRADNLEWCTYKYNSNYGTCQERKVRNRKPKKTEEYVQSKKIYQFDLEGNLVAEYGSVAEAGRSIGKHPSCIMKVVNGIMKKYVGYYWNTEPVFDYNPEYKRVFKKGALLQLDMDGNIIKRYTDARELEQDGYSQIQINRVCRGERKTYKGYAWKHEGDNI